MLLVLASMAVGAMTGCGKQPVEPEPGPAPVEPMPDEYNLLDNWAGNEAEEQYVVTKNAAGATVITYTDVTGEDSGGWQFVKRSFAYDAKKVARFNEYKKVVFEGNLVKTAGTDIVMVKVEGAGGTFEKRFTFAAEAKTYEFGLSFVSDWTQVSQILFFANRSTTESGSGVITLTKMALSKAEVVPANDIAPGMPTVPQGYALYKNHLPTEAGHEDDKVDVMYHWGYSNDGGIKTEEQEGAYKYKISWNATEKKQEWDWISSRIKNAGANLQQSGLKRVVFEVKGTAGQTAVFKFQSEEHPGANAQKEVKLTGADQVIAFSIEGVLAHADVAEDTKFMALIFPAGGKKEAAAGQGQIELKACYMDRHAHVDPNNVVKYPQVWVENPISADFVYDVTLDAANHKQTIAYDLAATPDYKMIKYNLQLNDDWFGAVNYRQLLGTIKADVNVQVLLKPFDAVEYRLDLVANEAQEINIEIAEDKVNFAGGFILFIGTAEGSARTGSVEIVGLRIARLSACVANEDGIIRLNKVNNTPEQQTVDFNVAGTEMTVNYEFANNGWRGIEFVTSNVANEQYDIVRGTLVSSVDTHVMLKPADDGANEIKLELKAGVPLEVNETLTVKLNDEWKAKFLIFIGYTEANVDDGILADPLTGSLVVKDLRLTNGGMLAPKGNYHGLVLLEEGDNNFVPIDMNFDNGELLVNREKQTITGGSFNGKTGETIIETSGVYGNLTGTYDEGLKVFRHCAVTGAAKDAIDTSFEIVLSGNCKFYDCNGTTAQLRDTFKRRYMQGSWQTNSKTDERIFSDTDHYISGSAVRNNGWTGGAVALNSYVDFPGGIKAQSFGFWVYNPSSTVVKLRIFIYRSANFGNNQELASSSGVEINSNGWTFLQYGVAGYLKDDVKMYNFQMADFTNSGVNLTYDNICIYM